MEFLRNPAIIIDNGSNHLKIGFEGDELPLSNIPNVAGISLFNGPFGSLSGVLFVGYEAIYEEADYLWHPIRDGKINSWESLEYIYNHYLYKTLDVDTTEHAFVITDGPFDSYAHKVKLAKLMFEKYGVPALSICDQGASSLRFSGRQTGLVVDCGASGCNIIPVCNGRSFRGCAERIKMGGDLVTKVLMAYMKWRKYEFQTLMDILTADEIKCNYCYVAEDFWKEFARDVNEGCAPRSVICIDSTSVFLGEEKYVCGEAMFKPTWASVKSPGIHHSILNAITRSPTALQPVLVENIVLCGGASMMQGFSDRLSQELVDLPGLSESKVISLPQQQVAGWIGASAMATEMKQTGGFITKDQFEEYGPNIVRNLFI